MGWFPMEMIWKPAKINICQPSFFAESGDPLKTLPGHGYYGIQQTWKKASGYD